MPTASHFRGAACPSWLGFCASDLVQYLRFIGQALTKCGEYRETVVKMFEEHVGTISDAPEAGVTCFCLRKFPYWKIIFLTWPTNQPPRVLFVALLGFLLPSHTHGSMHHTPNDIHCPADLHISFVHNSYTYYAPSGQFTNLTDWFFDQSCTLTTNTTGTDNAPGTTRSSETLMVYSMHSDTLALSYHWKTFKLTSAKMPALLFGPYTEAIRFGRLREASRATVEGRRRISASSRTPAPVAVYDTWYTVRAMILGAWRRGLERRFLWGLSSFGADFARQRNPTATESSMVKKALAGGSLHFRRIPVIRGDPSNFPTFKCCTT
ncbi:hypothetical protein DFH08DRAFT_828496 [Mycena albidolilacea]|uniref:Uncharacterized protein n=1 Tax=Mycena albidolilacea TaxID=1033008 RepID=A0AAD7E6C0_9AGAR|nr:hypothetical protein DFH08DRAFT_828496 [Mycena albidolilacea]